MMTSQEVATALRPFYFVVHPDRFWQYPKEKDTNENSLKQLNAHIENLIAKKQTHATRVTFYVRDHDTDKNYKDEDHDKSYNHSQESNLTLKQVNIDFSQRDNVNSAVLRILLQCKLSTDYLHRIGKQSQFSDSTFRGTSKPFSDEKKSKFGAYRGTQDVFWMRDERGNFKDNDAENIEEMIKKKPEQDLLNYLRENTEKAMEKLKTVKPIREEVSRLCNELKSDLKLEKLQWDCGWGMAHFRGCLVSLKTLKQQHEHDMKTLNGKTVVFGRETGVSFDGHVILSIEDVRHNWLELIRTLHKYDSLMTQLPFIESTLSGALRGIQIDHRKFRAAVMIQRYIQQLQKLTSALCQYFAINGFPKKWPKTMQQYQLVVECEAGPLMLSPTGQFIVPASCPAFVMIDFITENLDEANRRLQRYFKVKSKEIDTVNKCLTTFGIESIDKDDNITPDLMVLCCQKLLSNQQLLSRFLRGNRLRVSHYYSVLNDGEICIPWNFNV